MALKHLWNIGLAALIASGCDRPAAPATTADEEPEALSVTRWTDQTELFAEYPALTVGATSRFAIHLTRLDSFKALTEGGVAVHLRGGAGPAEVFRVDGPSRPGIFGVDVTPVHAGTRDLVIVLEAPGLSDEHRVGQVDVHATAEVARAAASDGGEEAAGISFLKEQQDPQAGRAAPPADDPHAGHVMPGAPGDPNTGPNIAAMNMSGGMQAHPATERGNPLVDMQTMMPASRLDDPGIGLRNSGRRVLTYADLRSSFEDPDGREPGRTIELHLTGHMERFAWSFNGIRFSDAEPLRLTYGERLRVVLVNDTMMTHPIHLHGMWSDVEDDDGQFHLRKHTVDMPPGTKRSYRVTADALGRWAYHCHLLFHMEAGMFREVRVEE